MNLKPLHDRVVVKADTAEEVTTGGIIIPDTAKKKPKQGTVMAVGPGKTENGVLIAPAVKKGDKVLFNEYAGVEVVIEEEEFLICHESDIQAIL